MTTYIISTLRYVVKSEENWGEATGENWRKKKEKNYFQWIKFSLTYNQPQRWDVRYVKWCIYGECREKKKEKFLPTPTHITIPYPIHMNNIRHPHEIFLLSLIVAHFPLYFSFARFCWNFCHLFSPLIDFIVPINEYRMTYNGRNGRMLVYVDTNNEIFHNLWHRIRLTLMRQDEEGISNFDVREKFIFHSIHHEIRMKIFRFLIEAKWYTKKNHFSHFFIHFIFSPTLFSILFFMLLLDLVKLHN